jgi:hypothetical protein
LKLLLLIAFAASLDAQVNTVAAFTSVDDCGGPSAFLGATYILEETSGFCADTANTAGPSQSSALPVTGIVRGSGTFQVTINSASVQLSAVETIQVGDLVFLLLAGVHQGASLRKPLKYSRPRQATQ